MSNLISFKPVVFCTGVSKTFTLALGKLEKVTKRTLLHGCRNTETSILKTYKCFHTGMIYLTTSTTLFVKALNQGNDLLHLDGSKVYTVAFMSTKLRTSIMGILQPKPYEVYLSGKKSLPKVLFLSYHNKFAQRFPIFGHLHTSAQLRRILPKFRQYLSIFVVKISEWLKKGSTSHLTTYLFNSNL